MSERNDQEWLDALAGRGGADATSSDAREARVLREAILRRADHESEPVENVDPERVEALIARAGRAGLLGQERRVGQSARAGRAPWLSGWRSGLAFAACAMLVIGLVLWLQPDIAPQTVRSVDGGVVRIEARNPVALKREIIEELRTVGIDASGYEMLGRQGIDAQLPTPVAPRVRDVLERHHIPMPADGALRLEIVAPAEK